MTATKPPIHMRDCPRYPACSAPCCPLDPDGWGRTMLPGERVCIWLTELVKPGGEQLVAQVLGDEPTRFVAQLLPEISEHYLIRRVLDRAAGFPSKLEAQRRLGQSRRLK